MILPPDMDTSCTDPQLTPEFIYTTLKGFEGAMVPPPLSIHPPFQPFTRVTIDSRQVIPGSLFIALPGEKLNGNDFIDSALSQGATGVLYQRGAWVHPDHHRDGVYLIPVENSLAAYRKLAQAWRKKFNIPVIAVAGSAGKTTTKELLAAVLSGKWQNQTVLKTEASQNGFIGIPLTLLRLQKRHQVAVIEIGIDEIGAMEQHLEVVQPNASILTSIGPEHLEKLIDINTVAREESLALTFVANTGGLIAVHCNDPWIEPLWKTLSATRKIGFSLLETRETGTEALNCASTNFIQGKITSTARSLCVSGMGFQETVVPLPLPGRHNAMNLLGAFAIAAGLGLTPDEILNGLTRFQGAKGRSELIELPGNTSVLCDYYNAQPASMKTALQLLSDISHSRSTWACLGDMLELGSDQEQFHRDLAQKIIGLGIDHVLLYGNNMLFLLNELQKRGFKGHSEHFQDQKDLTAELIRRFKPGHTLLIKGSRGMKMEEVWNAFKAHALSQWHNERNGDSPA